MTICVECGDWIDMDEEETEYTEDEGYRHWDCPEWEPETEEDERAVDDLLNAVAERKGWVEEAVHNGKLEELDVSEALERDLLDYVAELIDADELVERTRSRYWG